MSRRFKPTNYYGQARRYARQNAYRKNRRYSALQRKRYGTSRNVVVVKNTGEFKGLDTEMPLTSTEIVATTNTNEASFTLNLVRQGTGSWNRVGRKIKCKTLRIFGDASCVHAGEGTGTVRGNVLRMVVVWDKQPSGDPVPTFDEIFGHTVQDGTESTDFLDPRKYDNMDRFRVLKDCRYESNPGAAALDGASEVGVENKFHIDEFVRLKVGETVYGGQSEPMTIADVNSGAIYCYFRAEMNNATQTFWTTDLTARLRYQDN